MSTGAGRDASGQESKWAGTCLAAQLKSDMWCVMQNADTSGDASGEGSNQRRGFFSRTKEKVKRWKNRTFAQQEANKAAQKRYRSTPNMCNSLATLPEALLMRKALCAAKYCMRSIRKDHGDCHLEQHPMGSPYARHSEHGPSRCGP